MENISNLEILLIEAEICLICYEPKKESRVLNCNHFICQNCLRMYVETVISEGNVIDISCPSLKCEEKLSSNVILNIVSSESFEKYNIFLQNKTLEKNLSFRWCPAVGCTGFDYLKNENFHKLTCNKCFMNFCYICADLGHESQVCPLVSNHKNTSNWKNQNGLKFCPRCFCLSQKNGGCPMVTCAKCDEKWCWICGNSFSDHDLNECFLSNQSLGIYEIFLLLLIFFPLTYVFFLFIILIGMVYFEEAIRQEGGFEGFEIIMKYKYLAILSSLLISPILILSTTALFPLIYGIYLPIHFVIHSRDNEHSRLISCCVCGILCSPLLIGLMYCLFGLILFIIPLFAIGISIFRIYHIARRALH